MNAPHVEGWWGHSFEEDEGDVAVYRPEGYDFPLARGRDALEFSDEGEVVAYPIGAADRPDRGVRGHWERVGEDRLAVRFPDTTLRVDVRPDHLRARSLT